MAQRHSFDALQAYLARVPAVSGSIASGQSPDGNWWVKFALDLAHPLAWKTVQELGCVLNYLSLEERLLEGRLPRPVDDLAQWEQ
ncbi:MAG TPA: hypothetical protein VNB23_05780 [Ramlibacter sp.]|nr:hypothetical protein [Ramlibacter sp.]